MLSQIVEGLVYLYIKCGHLRNKVTEAEELGMLKCCSVHLTLRVRCFLYSCSLPIFPLLILCLAITTGQF